MSLQINYDSVFTADGLAKLDQDLPSALSLKNQSLTFQLTETKPSGLNRASLRKEKESRQTFALTIEECKPTTDYQLGDCTPLPSNVSFERVVSHVIDSFKNAFQVHYSEKVSDIKKGFQQRKAGAKYVFLGRGQGIRYEISDDVSNVLDEKEENLINKCGEEEERELKKLEKKLRVWQIYLSKPENEYIISDAFWYTRYKLVPSADSSKIMDYLSSRISKNYVDFFINVEGPTKDVFFKSYFDIVSQSVYYCLFYACPKSRDKLIDDIKEELLVEFSRLLGGVEVTSPKKYYSNWYLDLGAGNILKIDESLLVEQKKLSLPPINFKDCLEVKAIRTFQELGCSPIIGKFLASEKYQTRNYVRGLKMRFSELDYDAEEVEARFGRYKEIAKDIDTNVKMLVEQEKQAQKDLKATLRRIREENWRHQRRLSKRRDEELATGAHEYANYLVSILRPQSPKTTRAK